MKILGATIYPREAAATRLRLVPVLRALQDRGLETELWSYLRDGELSTWVSGGRARIGPMTNGLRRIPSGLRSSSECDLLLLQREALPFNVLVLERLVVRQGRPLVWDVDDALWFASRAPSLIRGSSEKYEWLARNASQVWAGSQHVADWATSMGANSVRRVPTTVPVPLEVNHDGREDDLLCWIGTPSTGVHIERLLQHLGPALRDWRVVVVGARIRCPQGVRVTQLEWSPAAEADALRRASVGLYPLDVAQQATRGKSALKSVLFMAHGIPVVATPTGSNLAVMDHGEEGFFADSNEDWIQHLHDLRDAELRHVMGSRGHRRASEEFDNRKWSSSLADQVCRLLSS